MTIIGTKGRTMYYKVVTIKRKSAIVQSSKYCLDYPKKTWIVAPKGTGIFIFIFEDKTKAKEFLQVNLGITGMVLGCDAKNPRPIRDIASCTSNSIDRFWSRSEENKFTWSAPSGSFVAEAIFCHE